MIAICRYSIAAGLLFPVKIECLKIKALERLVACQILLRRPGRELLGAPNCRVMGFQKFNGFRPAGLGLLVARAGALGFNVSEYRILDSSVGVWMSYRDDLGLRKLLGLFAMASCLDCCLGLGWQRLWISWQFLLKRPASRWMIASTACWCLSRLLGP